MTLKSGWCITLHHETCKEKYYGKFEEHNCDCSCHK